jgi:transposase
MGNVYVGLDVGSRSCHVVGTDKEGNVLLDRQFDTSEQKLVSVLEDVRGRLEVHLEASELAAWVRRILLQRLPRVQRVLVSHPQANAWIAKDTRKNDRVDATKLAMLLRTRLAEQHEVYYGDDQKRTAFKQVVRHYDDVTRQVVRLKQKVKARLRTNGLIARGDEVYTAEGRIKYINAIGSEAARQALRDLFELLDAASKTKEDAERLMKKEARRFPETTRLQKMPGVGPVSASRFVGYIQTPHRFGSKRKLWRYCRLGITDRSSDGKPLGRQALDRNGNVSLKLASRTAFRGAMKTREDNMFKRVFRKTMLATHDSTHARLTVQRKILAVMWALWKGGKSYRDDMG